MRSEAIKTRVARDRLRLTFQLLIEAENAVFGDGNRKRETARILRTVADQLEAGENFSLFRTLFDINGNDVGRAAFTMVRMRGMRPSTYNAS